MKLHNIDDPPTLKRALFWDKNCKIDVFFLKIIFSTPGCMLKYTVESLFGGGISNHGYCGSPLPTNFTST